MNLDFQSEKWQEVAKTICSRHKIICSSITRATQGEHIVFLLDDAFILKIYHTERNNFEREKLALETVRTTLKIPQIVAFDSFERFPYLLTTQIKGELMTRKEWLKLEQSQQIFILNELADGLRELHSPKFSNESWLKFVELQQNTYFQRQIKGKVNESVLKSLPEYVENNLKLLPTDSPAVFLHGDIHFGNLRFLNTNGRWQISGLFDFADSLHGLQEYDFLAIGVLMIQGQGNLQREFFRAYGYREAEIDETLRKRLMLLTILYECSDLRRYALRLNPEAVDWNLEELERKIWNFA